MAFFVTSKKIKIKLEIKLEVLDEKYVKFTINLIQKYLILFRCL